MSINPIKNLKHFKKMPHKTWLIALVLIILVITAFVAHVWYKRLNNPGQDKSVPVLVQTTHAKEASMPEVIDTIGLLSAEQEITLKAAVPGKINIITPSGTWVKVGTLLATAIGGAEVRAPFDGYLSDWMVKSGELVSPNTVLVDIVNTDRLSLAYKIPEQYAAKLASGQTVEITVRPFPDKIFKGTVQFIAPIVDKKTLTILVKADVENTDHTLWPGMSTHVMHLFKANPNAIVVPEAALNLTLEGYEVWTVKDGKIVRQPVEVGTRRGGRVQILKGVQLNDTVIVTRTDQLKEGLNALSEEWTGAW
jgi:multidrug efflux pump subunit AcrA (membrane-fusion protein)